MKIEINNLAKKYDDFFALDSINLSLNNGMNGLLGANGAGKTTLMKILAGVSDKTSGEISIDGINIKNKQEMRNKIGYIPQKFSFYPNLTVYETMDYFSVLNKMKRNRQDAIYSLLETVHLRDNTKLRIKELSGGMLQRLGIAVALIKNPELLIVDEPTVGLDPKERNHFNNVMISLANDRIILFSSHIVTDIESTCKKLSILNHGNVIFSGNKDELINDCQGKVWEITVQREKADIMEKHYSISKKQINNEDVKLRIISSICPVENAINVSPDLNDAYIYKIDTDEADGHEE